MRRAGNATLTHGLLAVATTLLLAGAARAEDPGFAPAKARFEAMPLEARRAIQRDLVWAGGFTGAATGEFGPLTFAALKRFETGANLKVDAVLETEERAALARAAQGARTAAGFSVETDKASGMRIGVPKKLLTKRSTNPAGLDRWQDSAGKVTLDLQQGKPDDQLEALFAKGTDSAVAGRKVTYKLLRPEFFVITGETAGGKFYRRMEKGADGTLRGFALGYDKGVAAAVDPLVIAMATSFEAVPGAAPTPEAKGASAGAGAAVPSQAPVPLRTRRLTGVVLGDGRIVTAQAPARACKGLTLDSAAREMLSIEQADSTGGLVVLSRPRGALKPLPLGVSTPESAVLLQRDGEGRLIAAAATLSQGRALAPVQDGGSGAALLDSTGALVGIVASEPMLKYAFNGTLPALRYRVVPSSEIMTLLGGAPAPAPAGGGPLSAGEIGLKAGSGIVSILCGG